jgi:hypothetical protein
MTPGAVAGLRTAGEAAETVIERRAYLSPEEMAALVPGAARADAAVTHRGFVMMDRYE